jgi:hypothetical protein
VLFLVGTSIGAILGGSDRVGRRLLFGLLIGIAGVAAIAGGAFEAENTIAIVQVGVVVVCYEVEPFILSRRLAGVSSLGMMAPSLTLVVAIHAPIALLSWPATGPSQTALLEILVLAVV